MSASMQDRPRVNPASFSASLVETPGVTHTLTVSGEAVGDYRVQGVRLVRAHRQGSAGTLVLDVTATLEPVESAPPDFERVWPLRYAESPARDRYTKVRVVNGDQHFIVDIVAAL